VVVPTFFRNGFSRKDLCARCGRQQGHFGRKVFWFKKALKHIGLSVKLVFEGEEEVPTCGAIFLKTSADSVIMEGLALDTKGKPQVVLV
jgi:hypothetical protein